MTNQLHEHLSRPPDLDARIIYFPVRHHSPACAWHLDRLIRQVRPDAVLIEGPRDASPLIPLLSHPGTTCPVAIYTTFTDRGDGNEPRRHAAYYPLCDYSPERAAVCAGAAVGAAVRFIDLTFPERVRAGRLLDQQKPDSLQDERRLRHSRFLQAACRRAGTRDPDDLWDHLFEVAYRDLDTGQFLRNVLAYCELARRDTDPAELEADGTLARERAMADAVARETGRMVVVTGGFHTVALPQTEPAMPQPVKVTAADALVVLMRYGFEQLDRLNGYAAGMPSPGFYQWQWEQRPIDQIFVDLGRRARRQRQEISVADEIAAADQCRRLARLRGHAAPSREDVLDSIRAAFVKGAADAEGLLILALTRQLLAGDRVGDLPPEAQQPPIVADFRSTAKRLGIALDRIRATDTHLDLYRRENHREASRFFHRLNFLEVPFAELVRGPDFVTGEGLERVQEVWKYHFSPQLESALIERGLYGASLEEATLNLLLQQFAENERHGNGRRADLAARLLLEACRMGLHRHAAELLTRTADLVAEDAFFPSLVRTVDTLLVLHVSREPLEAHTIAGITDLAAAAFERTCYLIPSLARTPEPQESEVLGALVDLAHCAQTLGDTPQRQALRIERLQELLAHADPNPCIQGAAAGLLYGDGRIDPERLAGAFRGNLLGGAASGESGPAFLRGLLRTARSALWQVPQLLVDLHDLLRRLDEPRFLHQLPLLRLALADLTPRETDTVARAVAAHAGVASVSAGGSTAFSSEDLLLALDVEGRVRDALARDSLQHLLEPVGGST